MRLLVQGTVGTKMAFKSHSRPHLPQTPAASV